MKKENTLAGILLIIIIILTFLSITQLLPNWIKEIFYMFGQGF